MLSFLSHFTTLLRQLLPSLLRVYPEKLHDTVKSKKESEEKGRATELDSDTEETLELSDQEFKITVFVVLSVLEDKEDKMQKQMGNVRREMTFKKITKKKCYTASPVAQW